MKYCILSVGFLVLSHLLQAQGTSYSKPDYDSIQRQISDSNSVYYYPVLMERCLRWDTSLTYIDYRFLYYGYTFQPQYNPYWRSPHEDKMLTYYRKKELSKKDCEAYIRFADASLAECPLDLRTMNFLAYVYQLKGDQETADAIRYKFSMILNAILSTGNGESCETGFHVISPGHEYVVLSMFQFKITQQTLTSDLCDFMTVEKDERGIEGIFFNISRLWNLNRGMLKRDTK